MSEYITPQWLAWALLFMIGLTVFVFALDHHRESLDDDKDAEWQAILDAVEDRQ